MIYINDIKKPHQKLTMDITTIKEQQKKENLARAIETRDMNRKKDKFNNFTHTEHKRNKSEQKLYLLLKDDQRNNIKLICEVLGLNIEFFQYWFNKNHRLYMANIEPVIKWVILKAPEDGIEPEGITAKNIDEIHIIINETEYRKKTVQAIATELYPIKPIEEVEPIKTVEPIKEVDPIDILLKVAISDNNDDPPTFKPIEAMNEKEKQRAYKIITAKNDVINDYITDRLNPDTTKPIKSTAIEDIQDVEIIHKKTIEETADALAVMTPSEKVEFAKNTLKKLSLKAPKLKQTKPQKKAEACRITETIKKIDSEFLEAIEQVKNPEGNKPYFINDGECCQKSRNGWGCKC